MKKKEEEINSLNRDGIIKSFSKEIKRIASKRQQVAGLNVLKNKKGPSYNIESIKEYVIIVNKIHKAINMAKGKTSVHKRSEEEKEDMLDKRKKSDKLKDSIEV